MFLLNRERSNDELGKVVKTVEVEREGMSSFFSYLSAFWGLVLL